MNLLDVIRAENRIREYIRKTPMEYSEYYSGVTGGKVFMKLESLQVTGSFKVRGALNKIITLSDEERSRGVVTASAGNHGKALAYASMLFGIKAVIFVPEYAPKTKIEAIKGYGAELKIVEGSYDKAEKKAHEYAVEHNMTFVSPYNDPQIISGQGTIGLEILRDKPSIENIVVPVGGGGLISGISLAAKEINPEIRVYGVQSASSPVMYESLKAGRIVEVELKPSIAEGLHGNIEKGSITFDVIKKYVDEMLLVEEEDIANAIRDLVKHHQLISEGAGAAGLAAIHRYRDKFKGEETAVVVSGRNIDLERIKKILCS